MSQAPSEHAARRGAGWKLVLRALGALSWLITSILLLVIGFYRRVISPGLRPRCRFLPSCSEYAEIALRKHGLVKGTGKTIWRLARCHPLCKGGYDEP